jgi:hypothetical protein
MLNLKSCLKNSFYLTNNHVILSAVFLSLKHFIYATYEASFNLNDLNFNFYNSVIQYVLVCGRWDYRHKNGSESHYRYSVLLVLPISSSALLQLLASCHILWVRAGLTLVTSVLSVFGHDIWISSMPVCFEVCTLVSGYQPLEGYVNPPGDQTVRFSAVRLQPVHCCFGQQWPQII